MSAKVDQARALLQQELQTGSASARDLLAKAVALGLNRDFLKAAKKQLGILAIRARDRRTGKTRGWRWAMPTRAPIPPRPRPSIRPHRWGCYSFHTEGRYYSRQDQAGTFTQLQQRITARQLASPLWVLLITSADSEAELSLPIRLSQEAVAALGQCWLSLSEVQTREWRIRRKIGRRR